MSSPSKFNSPPPSTTSSRFHSVSALTSPASSNSDRSETATHGQHVYSHLIHAARNTDKHPSVMKGLADTYLGIANILIPSSCHLIGHEGRNSSNQRRSIYASFAASIKSTKSHLTKSIVRFFKDSPRDRGDATPLQSPIQGSSSPIQIVGTTVHTTALNNSATPNAIEFNTLHIDTLSRNLPHHRATFTLPSPYSRIDNTSLLVYCCSVLSKWRKLSKPGSVAESQQDTLLLNDNEKEWAKNVNFKEQSHYHELVNKMVIAFVEDPIRSADTIAEIVLVGPVLEKNIYCRLLSCFISKFKDSTMLDLDLLRGLVQLVECAPYGYLVDNDLVGVALTLSNRLSRTHIGSSDHHLYLIWALSRILDVMVANSIKDLNRNRDHQPILQLLTSLKNSDNIYVRYQATYAFQAFQYIPDDETPLQVVWRYVQGAAQVASAVTSILKIDPKGFLDGVATFSQICGEVADILTTTIEGGRAIGEGAQILHEGSGTAIRTSENISSNIKKRSWYLALQGSALFLQQSRFSDFKMIVNEAPCRNNPNFQWGICRQLGEVAVDLLLNPALRQQAVEFLYDLNKGNNLKLHEDVKQWIRTILDRVSLYSYETVKSRSISMDVDIYQDRIRGCSKSYPLNKRLFEPRSYSLLVKAQDIPEVEHSIQILQSQRLKEYFQPVYIPPMARHSLSNSDDTLFYLLDKVKEFLAGDCQVMLILGDSGAGKSTFNRYLENELWKEYNSGGRIPLFINIPAIEQPKKNLIQERLGEHNFSKSQILELLHHRQFTLICDGYDESQLKCNLHTSNNLKENTKLIISCRSQNLVKDYHHQFMPIEPNQYYRPAKDLFQECVISPFTKSQIDNYVEQYISLKPRSWTKTDYIDKLETIPHLMELVQNPFLLSLCLEALPKVVQGETDLSRLRMTRTQLYDNFVQHWLEVNKQRHITPMNNESRKELEAILEDGFEWRGFNYQMELATAIFQEQDGRPVVDYSRRGGREQWKAKFFGPDPELVLLRDSSLLTQVGTQRRFVHRSVQEYFYSCSICGPTIDGTTIGMQEYSSIADHPLSKRSLVEEPSILQFVAERAYQDTNFKQHLLALIEQSKRDQDAAQAAANAITILVMSGMRFNGHDLRGVRIPGADLSGGQFDSVQLQGADLRGSNLSRSWIRQVDFSKALMEGVEFGELPSLQFTDFVQSCAYSPDGKTLAVGLYTDDIIIYDTDNWRQIQIFKGHSKAVNSLAFSPSGNQLLSGSNDRTVRLWRCLTGVADFVMRGHNGAVLSIAYSPNGKQLASASDDWTVRLWDAGSGSVVFVFLDNTARVYEVIYSPDGMTIATASGDGTIRTYNTQTGQAKLTVDYFKVFNQLLYYISSIAYSPDGSKIVAGHGDGQIRMWDSFSGYQLRSWKGHINEISRVIFSPNGRWIVSCSIDRTVGIWSAQTGRPVTSLIGHRSYVNDIVFSSSNLVLASGSGDRTVRLWNLGKIKMESSNGNNRIVDYSAFSLDGQSVVSVNRSGTVQWYNALSGELAQTVICGCRDTWKAVISPDCLRIAIIKCNGCEVQVFSTISGLRRFILAGHTERVSAVAFSSNGRLIATGSDDTTICLWDICSGTLVQIFVGGTDGVARLEFSPNNQQIVSIYKNNINLVWEVDTGVCRKFYEGEGMDDHIYAVRFSPSGQQIAVYKPRESVIATWYHSNSEIQYNLESESGLDNFAWSYCEQWIATACNSSIWLWNRSTDKSLRWICVAVVRGFLDEICSISWKNDKLEFVTTCRDRSIRVWRVVETLKGWSVQLVWSAGVNALVASRAIYSEAIGLSTINQNLLAQRDP